MTEKEFSVGKAAAAEAIAFRLTGTDVQGNPIDPIRFVCLPDIQGTVLTETLTAMESRIEIAAPKIMGFIGDCLPEDEAQRFHDVTHSKDVIVDIDTLAAISAWLVEVYASRPTKAPVGLPGGQSSTTTTSTGATTTPASPIPEPSASNGSSTPSTPASLTTSAS